MLSITRMSLLCASAVVLMACQETGKTTNGINNSSTSSAFTALNQLKQVQLELADTSEKQELGLMNRTSIPENTGMLFAFTEPRTYCFWMKNTLIPLTIGFLDEQGVLRQTEDMAPQTLSTHCAKTAVKYAIEMNQGWYATHKVNIGTPLLHIK
ncbi:hypothetical protein DTO96_101650 [Ephemeroptericola cinctiostellae]|uniref:DUF192 domain-containing protein n=1 Tax=Ephemeroptericola cinctiostellae TaxID=2268024 RepID=A0A345DC22_9BURK|nr:DUF192 domain-containing protein [Ephemeroptericola cinctiostellae]AXF85910.1 hypothetical protein DTO96_101650 [Ephemeroptericola cinctiostellae]